MKARHPQARAEKRTHSDHHGYRTYHGCADLRRCRHRNGVRPAGVGNLVVSAVLRRDYPVIQGALLIIAALYVLINFAIDMFYLLVDPRVRY